MTIDFNIKPVNGVFLLKGKEKILIVSTKNIITYLYNSYKAIELGIRNLDEDFINDFISNNITLTLLEESGFKDSFSLNLRLRKYLDFYKNSQFYTHQKLGTHYKIVIRILKKNRKYKACVMLKPGRHNNSKKFTVVGIFDTMIEAKEWCEKYYPNPDNVYEIVIHI